MSDYVRSKLILSWNFHNNTCCSYIVRNLVIRRFIRKWAIVLLLSGSCCIINIDTWQVGGFIIVLHSLVFCLAISRMHVEGYIGLDFIHLILRLVETVFIKFADDTWYRCGVRQLLMVVPLICSHDNIAGVLKTIFNIVLRNWLCLNINLLLLWCFREYKVLKSTSATFRRNFVLRLRGCFICILNFSMGLNLNHSFLF